MYEIARAELLYPETALAIAIVETGAFRSKWMMKHFNWFGFRATSRGYQTRIERGYGVYGSPELMLKDYRDFESEVISNHGLTSETLFRAWIARHYAADRQYGAKLALTVDLIAACN